MAASWSKSFPVDDPPLVPGLFQNHQQFYKTLEPEIKGNVHADEVIVKTKGKKNWYWGAKKQSSKSLENSQKGEPYPELYTFLRKLETDAKVFQKKSSPTSWRITAEPIIYFSTDCEEVVNLFTVFQLVAKNMGLNITIIVLNGIMSVLSRDIKPIEDSRIHNRQKIS